MSNSVGASLPGAAPTTLEQRIRELVRSHPMFAPISDDTASPTQRQMDEHGTKQRQQQADGFAAWLVAHGISLGAALEAGPSPGEQSHETERPDAPDTISLLRTNLVGANRRVGDLTGLLLEWLDTPFFATEADWRAWVEDFRPRVLAVIQGGTNSQPGVRGESVPPQETPHE